jgi:hypothetical protein
VKALPMRVFALDCYADKDADPSVVMIVAAETEAAAIRLAFDHPNAEGYEAIAVNRRKKSRRAADLAAGIHGFVNWSAFRAL